MSESDLYGVATFYGNFSLDAKGKYILKVCRGTACHVRKSGDVLNTLLEATGLSEKKSISDDGLFHRDRIVPRRVRTQPGRDGQRHGSRRHDS